MTGAGPFNGCEMRLAATLISKSHTNTTCSLLNRLFDSVQKLASAWPYHQSDKLLRVFAPLKIDSVTQCSRGKWRAVRDFRVILFTTFGRNVTYSLISGIASAPSGSCEPHGGEHVGNTRFH